jgi:putative sigma-54 modulation protein
MVIEVKGRNLAVTDDLREAVERRFEKVSKQVSEFATLEVEFSEERNPANPDSCIAEATLQLKGVTLRAKESSRDLKHAPNLVADDMSRQVKRHRDKRRNRREARAGSPRAAAATAPPAPAPFGEASAPPA